MDLAGECPFPFSEGRSLVFIYLSGKEKFPPEHCQHFIRRFLSAPTLLLVYVTPFPLKYLRAVLVFHPSPSGLQGIDQSLVE